MQVLEQEKLEDQLKACIHCGMCLPACPTYQVSHNEANSPRGRLYLINEHIKGSDLDKEKTVEYLDDCLSCYACETACPSNVDYADILDYARHDLKLSNYSKNPIRKFFFAFLISNRSALRYMRRMLRTAKPFLKILMPLFGFGRQAKLLPKFTKYKTLKPGMQFFSKVELDLEDEERTLNFALGCVMDTVYNQVHWDTIEVLNAFGYHVHISRSDCCGSLASHSGEFEIGTKQKEKFVQQIQKENMTLVTNSAGCGAFLENEDIKVIDFVTALKNAPYKPKMQSDEKILYHPACHLNHRQGVSADYEDLLQTVAGLEIETVDNKDLCCGSAGFYNLIKPKIASEIGKLKISEIKEKTAKTIVTANPGCMSQIQALLDKGYTVLHPASYLHTAINANDL